MKQRYAYYLLGLFFLLLVILKIGIVGSVAYPDYDAYFGIRQVEHIHNTGLPIITDELSYQGRIQANSLFFYAVMAIIAVLIPTIALFKYASIFFGLVALFFIYKGARDLFSSDAIALCITFLAGLSPSLFSAHLNTLVPSSLFFALYAALLYTFIHIDKYVGAFLVLLVIAVLTSPLSLLFVFGFLLYIIITKIESLPVRALEFELCIFGIIFALWYHLVIYKQLILSAGISTISQTVPQAVLLSSFQNFTPALAVVFIGIVPLLLGMYGTYATLFEKRQRKLLFFIGQLLAFGFVLWSGNIPVQDGFMYVTITLLFLSGYALQRANAVFRKTIVPKAQTFVLIVLVLIVAASFLPTLALNREVFVDAPSEDEIYVLEESVYRVPPGSTILGHMQQGHLISAVGKHKNFYDENFLLAPQVQQRYEDARKMFLSRSQTTTLSLAQVYGIDYIYFTPLLNESIPSDAPLFTDSDCFRQLVQEGDVVLYEITCQLEN